MLDSIYRLGIGQSQITNSIVSPTVCKFVIGVIFEVMDKNLQYKEIKRYQFDKEDPSLKCLYRRSSGRPERGIFLTSDISKKDIEEIHKIFSKDKTNQSNDVEFIKKFKEKKLGWFTHS